MAQLALVTQQPPAYCQYAAGGCDQSFRGTPKADAFFAFPTDPPNLAATVQAAVAQLTRSKPNHKFVPWTALQVTGQIIFCEICKQIRFSDCFVADVTVLNFNVLFELGYALGLEKPVRLLRDTSYKRDNEAFDQLGVIDTVGYDAYTNSDAIVAKVLEPTPRVLPLPSPKAEYRSAPLFVVLPHIETEAVARLTSSLNQTAFKFRSFDPKETSRLSLSDIQRHVASSTAVVAPLLDPERDGASVHNGRCALVAGMALARGLHVLMVQEGGAKQPIDYRDLVQPHTSSVQIRPAIERLVKQVASTVTSTSKSTLHTDHGSVLASLDLGDVAAENEDATLDAYFISTAQYQEISRGRARLVVGRKGTGKSAIFSQLRQAYARRAHDYLVVDLRPEGYQLKKLVDLLRSVHDAGTREHLAVTVWYFVLVSELARAILDRDINTAYREPATVGLFQNVEVNYQKHCDDPEADFSDRLLTLVSRMSETLRGRAEPLSTQQVNAAIWKGDLGPLTTALSEYLREKKEVWILVDNLDKSWPAHGATAHEMLVLRGVLEASRKAEKALRKSQVPIRTVVFIRNDIYDHLLSDIPDRGKETVVRLDQSDHEFLRNVLLRRAAVSLGRNLKFDEFVRQFFELHVGGVDTFRYLFHHTFGRPRDAIRLTKRCVETAVNRGHDKVSETDAVEAVRIHSNDVLSELVYEIRDSLGDQSAAVLEFIGAPVRLTRAAVTDRLEGFDEPDNLLRVFLWYSFLGIALPDGSEAFSYQEQYDVERMLRLARTSGDETFVIHPAFHAALHISSDQGG